MDKVDNIHYDYSTISISVKDDKFVKKYIKEKKERLDPYTNPIKQFRPFQKPLDMSNETYLKSPVFNQPLHLDKVLMKGDHMTNNFENIKKLHKNIKNDYKILFSDN